MTQGKNVGNFEVLVVDDNKDNLQLLEKLLTEAGYHVRLATSGKLALKSLQIKLPDIILLDIKMPEMDGFEVCRLIKGNAETSSLPIIFITVMEDEKSVKKAFQSGAVDYINIPFSSEEVLTRVNTHLQLGSRLKSEAEGHRSAEERFRQAFRISPDSMSLYRLSDYMCLDINEEFTETTGYTREDVIYKDAGKSNIWLNENERKHFLHILTTNRSVKNYESLFRKKDGTVFSGLFSAVVMNVSGEEQAFAILRDITDRKTAEDNLKNSENSLNRSQEIANLGSWEYDIKNNTTTWSNNLFRIYGLTPNAIKPTFEYFKSRMHPDDVRLITEGLEKIMDEKGPLTLEMRIITADGKQKWIYNRIEPSFINGELASLKGINLDITERKEASEALMESEKKFKIFFFNSPVAKSITYLDGKFIPNRAFAQMTGYSEDELKDKRWQDITFPDDISKTQTIYNSLVAEETEQQNFEKRFVHKSGSIIWAEVSSRIFIGKSNKPEFFISVINDITQRRIIEERLKTLSRAVEQSPVTIVITDKLGNIEYTNPHFTELTGYSPEEVIGKNPRILSTGEKSKIEYSEMWQTILSGGIWKGEFHNKRKDGLLFWENAIISPILDEKGVIVHFVAVKEDITEKKKIIQDLIEAKDKAEEMNRLKSNFLANMSHELRTPMIGILGYAEILSTDIEDEGIKEMGEIIHNSAQRLMNTLNLILNLSRIEADRLDIKTTPVDVILLTREIVALYKPLTEKKGIYLSVKTDLDRMVIFSDEKILYEIINNLLNNAVKFTSTGGVTISISLDTLASPPVAVIKVTDTGLGIKEEDIPIIWQEFRQVSEGKSRGFEGTGLGLTITKNFVRKLNGEIMVSSEPNAGSTFIVRLPAEKGSIPETGGKEPDNIHDLSNNVPAQENLPQILYVEDDAICIDFVRRILNDRVKLDVVTNGKAALEKALTNNYKTILMDINLGKGMDGLETTRRIREIAHCVDIPIVAVTAFAMVGEKEEFFNGGCTHYISKPFKKAELLNIVDEALRAAK